LLIHIWLYQALTHRLDHGQTSVMPKLCAYCFLPRSNDDEQCWPTVFSL